MPDVLPPLAPLPYHLAVVDFLRTHEPEVWQWARSARAQEDHAEVVRGELLKQTYRLDADTYPDLHRSCAVVAGRLDLQVPVTLYQAGDGAMNATLYFLPGEAHVVFAGPLLERMKGAELEAVLGHELAHHLLWERDGGIFHAADRVLSAVADDPRATPSQLQTARLYRLYTEAFADRGGAIAAGELAPAVAALVKTQTGLAEVSAASYLKQADEIFGSGRVKTEGSSHPEVFVRARALRLWCESDPAAEDWLSSTLQGPLSLDALDLPAQHRLQALTRRMLAQLLRQPFLRTETMLAHARRFFPDFRPNDTDDASLASEIGALAGIHDYVSALLMDLAAADRDLDDVALASAVQAAQHWGVADTFERMALRGLRLTKRQFTKVRQDAASLLERAARQHA